MKKLLHSTMGAGSYRKGDGVNIVLKVRSKEEVKSVCCMVMMIRNTCRIFDNLFQFLRNREVKSLSSPNISVSGLEPVSMGYTEVSNIENFSMWV